MAKYKVRVPGIFISDVEINAGEEIEAIVKVREILRDKADKLIWEYESISPEDYWQILKIDLDDNLK